MACVAATRMQNLHAPITIALQGPQHFVTTLENKYLN